jgi:hypothetical protein
VVEAAAGGEPSAAGEGFLIEDLAYAILTAAAMPVILYSRKSLVMNEIKAKYVAASNILN